METPLPFLLLCHLNVTNRQIKKSLQPTPLFCLLGQCKKHCEWGLTFILFCMKFPMCGWNCLVEGSVRPVFCTFESLEKFLKNIHDLIHSIRISEDGTLSKVFMKSLSNDANIWFGLRLICQRNSVRKFYQGPYVVNSQVSKLSPREVSLPWATGKWQDWN